MGGIPADRIRREGGAGDLTIFVRPHEKQILGLTDTRANGVRLQNEKAYVAFKYYDSAFQCLSLWQEPELRALSEFFSKVTQYDWIQLQKMAGQRGEKTGLAPTAFEPNTVRHAGARERLKSLKSRLSEDIDFFELRVNGRARVHGFRAVSTFFLVLLDKDHEVLG